MRAHIREKLNTSNNLCENQFFRVGCVVSSRVEIYVIKTILEMEQFREDPVVIEITIYYSVNLLERTFLMN